MLSIITVDDEPLALRRLELAISRIPDVALLGQARSGRQAIELIETVRPDVVLLDVQMPGLDGFDLLDALSPAMIPSIIFVTAYESFAVRAFEVEAVDYIVKPVREERLRSALTKVCHGARFANALERAEALRKALERMRDTVAPANDQCSYVGEFWAECRGEQVRVPVDCLDWIEAERDYVRLHSRGRSFLIKGPLQDVEAALDPAFFVRISRSAVVRAQRVVSVRKPTYGDFRLQLAGGPELRVGKTYLQSVRKLVGPEAT